MKKEELIALGVDEKTAEQILTINERDIENYKKLADSYHEDAKKTKEELEKFKDVDVDELNKQVNDWKTKYETETKELNDKLESQAIEFKVKDYLSQFQFTSERVKSSIMTDFMRQGFKLDEKDNFIGADEYMKKLQESEPTSFVGEDKPYFVKGTQRSDTKFDKKSLDEMTYSETIAFLAANPGYQL